tara:strand:- start:995 stop:1624 length:630 start_codon:yes stop_codon:yes gene_type:complete
MNIEIKKSKKPIKYDYAIQLMERRLLDINKKNKNELLWILEHEEVYTAGTSYKKEEIIDKSIKILKTNRGGKITYHGPGQLICYFVIDLKKRNRDIRKFISLIEKTIIDTLKIYKIKTFADKKNIGIWYKDKENIKKIAAIGVRVSKWIAYHGFSINICNDLGKYNSIIPCGIKNKGVTSLIEISNQNYNTLGDKIIKNFTFNLKNLNV